MSAALSSHQDPASRSWWSLSKSSTQHVPQFTTEKSRSRSKSGLNFNTLASAMGLKSKKHHPSLAIQDPPPLQAAIPSPSNASQVQNHPNRPPSKSVSSTRSRADSVEPRTPSDVHRATGRHSLLTLSDIDPFAGRSILSPHLPSDPSRLSAHSNSSVNDHTQKRSGDLPLIDRRSFASSSSQSHVNSGEPSASPLKQTLSPLSSTEGRSSHRLNKMRSTTSLNQKQPFVTTDTMIRPSTAHPAVSKSRSSTTLIGLNQRSSQPQPTPPQRLALRPRGLTDSGTTQRAGFFAETSTSFKKTDKPATIPRRPSTASHNVSSSPQPVSPRVVIRQASLQRIIVPPSAPPTQGLPATPQSPIHDVPDEFEPGLQARAESTSSSTLSFASSTSSSNDILVNKSLTIREKTRRTSDRSIQQTDKVNMESPPANPVSRPLHLPSTSPSTLKKVLSHQSLLKRGQLFISTPTQPSIAPETDKVPIKQRSFPQSRIPIPPIPLPLRHANSYSSVIGENASSSSEQRRGSSSSHSGGRKRLFSGSSLKRPSTSNSVAPEDDNQSVFSLRSDQDLYISTSMFKPWTSTTPQSFWDEVIPDTTPNSPVRSVADYMPQKIMSPAELAKVEANGKAHSASLTRQRGLSLLSLATATSEGDSESVPMGLSPPPIRSRNGSSQSSGRLPSRKTSDATKPVTPPTRLPERPSTAQPASGSVVPFPDHSMYRPSSSPPPCMASLPPPPRPRPRPTVIAQPDPPAVVSLPPPPPRRLSRSKVGVEKTMHRRSIMRKPSFLEIDDETDKDSDGETIAKPINSSFLDLARESFDTVRSNH